MVKTVFIWWFVYEVNLLHDTSREEITKENMEKMFFHSNKDFLFNKTIFEKIVLHFQIKLWIRDLQTPFLSLSMPKYLCRLWFSFPKRLSVKNQLVNCWPWMTSISCKPLICNFSSVSDYFLVIFCKRRCLYKRKKGPGNIFVGNGINQNRKYRSLSSHLIQGVLYFFTNIVKGDETQIKGVFETFAKKGFQND